MITCIFGIGDRTSDNHPVLELVVGCGGAPNYPYDNVGLNKTPATDLFINAAKPTVNTGGYPAYWGCA